MDEVSTPTRAKKKELGSILTKTSRVGGPVTCVTFAPPSSIFWGFGPYLHRNRTNHQDSNEVSNNKLLVFPRGGSIHGITYYVDPNKQCDNSITSSFDAVVFGGCQLAFSSILSTDAEMKCFDVISLKEKSTGNTKQSQPQHHLNISDWIWAVTFVDSKASQKQTSSSAGSPLNMVLGLAHHKIEIWNVDVGGETTDPIIQVSRVARIDGSPCVLLTSMHLLPNHDKSNLMIAAGSSFHNIHIWSVDNNNMTDSNSHCLKGHAGVIHSVKFSPGGKTLVSTSDDRSVRLWKANGNQWALEWTGWGHTARVWSIALFADCDGNTMVASVAEDGKLLVWCCQTGRIISSIQHACSLWSIDMLGRTAMVGTCQGTVELYNLDTRIDGQRFVITDDIAVPDDRPAILPPEEPLSSLGNSEEENNDQELPTSKKKTKKKKKVANQVIVGLEWFKPLDDGEDDGLILATRAGSMMKYSAKTNQWAHISAWSDESADNNNNILATDGCCMGLCDGELAAIGTTKGHIVLVSLSENGTSASATPKRHILSGATNLKSVQSLEWINETTMISFHVRGVAIWVFPSSDEQSFERVQHPAYILNRSDSNKAIPTCCAYDYQKQIAVVGDSRGTISLFELTAEKEHGFLAGPCICDVHSSIPRVHQKEHVTKITFISSTSICSVGNDGNLHMSYIHSEDSKLILSKGWSMPASTMTGISDLIVMPPKRGEEVSSDVYVSGYYGNTYRMIDMSSGYEFFSVETGGRQRIHAFSSEMDNQQKCRNSTGFKMAVCRNNKDGTNTLCVHHTAEKRKEEELSSTRIFHHGQCIHRETIFSACFFSLGSIVEGKETSFLLTGSEDCSSKISVWESGECVESISLTPQESCVRAVCKSQFDEKCALLVVGGGKLVLQFFFVTLNNNKSGIMNTMMDLQIQFRGHGVAKRNCTIDHRINDVKAIPLDVDSRTHLIVACDSDGNCHIFLMSESASRPGVPVGIFIPTSARPLLCVNLVPIGTRILVLLGTTGGEILVYDLPGAYVDLVNSLDGLAQNWKEFTSYQGHQMGTNAICTSIIPSVANHKDGNENEVRIRICSGGDDQAICICELRIDIIDERGCLTLVDEPNIWFKKEASFSAIKGVLDFYNKAHGKHIIVAVGYSQQLVAWIDDRHGEGNDDTTTSSDLSLLDRIDVDLGDVNCFAVDKTTNSGDLTSKLWLAVCGMGIECFSLTLQ